MSHPTLVRHFWSDAAQSLPRQALLAVVGSALVALSAQVQVPMVPVPMTLQTLAVLAIGAAFGARLAAATLLLYVAEAALGLPVMAGFGGGLARLMGPTGGYVLGFVLAAFVVGKLAERGWDRNGFTMFAAMLGGAALIYVPGMIWLSGFVGGLGEAFSLGVLPFLWGDVVKAAIAALAFPAVWNLSR